MEHQRGGRMLLSCDCLYSPIAFVSSLLAFNKENLNFALTSLFGQLTRSKYNDR